MANEVTDSEDLASDAGSTLDQLNDLLDKDDAKGDGKTDDVVEEKGDVADVDLPQDIERREAKEEGEEEEEEIEDEDLLEEEEEHELRASEEPQIIKDINKKYPNLFKEFKPLRQAILRDNGFTQVFSTPREAQETAQLNDDYKEFEHEILAGNNEKVLKAIAATNAEGYGRFVKNFLPSLAEMDNKSYVEVTTPVVADVLRKVYETGVARGDKNLVNSSRHIASLIWPNLRGQVPDHTVALDKKSPELEERERKIAEREQRHEQERAQEFVTGLKGTSNRLLRKRVEKGLDPNNALSPFLKNSVVEKTMTEVQELLNEDQRFNTVMQRTFERAKRSGFASEYRTRMVGTYIGRATQLIGPIRRRLLLSALGKTEKRDGGEKPAMRRDAGEGVATGGRERTLKASEIDFGSSSDLDILSGKAKPRQRPQARRQ